MTSSYYGNYGNSPLTAESPYHTLSSIIQDDVRKSSGVQPVLNEFEYFVMKDSKKGKLPYHPTKLYIIGKWRKEHRMQYYYFSFFTLHLNCNV